MARGGFPSMTALLGLLAVAGYQNRDRLSEMMRQHQGGGMGGTSGGGIGSQSGGFAGQSGGMGGGMGGQSGGFGGQTGGMGGGMGGLPGGLGALLGSLIARALPGRPARAAPARAGAA